MLSASKFRDLVSGRSRGWRSSVARGLLRCAEVPYTAIVQSRNLGYDRGWLRTHPVEAVVVSVGNLTMGGTGKTPMVQWLADWFQHRDARVILVSRGYKAAPDAQNDEALELSQKLPDVPHLQNPDRVAAARQAIAEHESQVILLDDAFQHRRIHRDLDIVLVDALEPSGFGHVFPRGTLREPLRNLRRADVVVLSRSDAIGDQQRAGLRDQIRGWAPRADWIEVVHEPRALLSANGVRQPLGALAGRRVLAFCGIGNPAGFRHTLASSGYDVADFIEFPDHHLYDEQDLQRLSQWSRQFGDAAAVICTHKDLVKINRNRIESLPLCALEIGVVIRVGQDLLENRLRRLAASCVQ